MSFEREQGIRWTGTLYHNRENWIVIRFCIFKKTFIKHVRKLLIFEAKLRVQKGRKKNKN